MASRVMRPAKQATPSGYSVPWSRVEGFVDRVAIVATGSSLRDFDLELLADLKVIAVNGAILALPFEPIAWVTVDTSPTNRAIMKRRMRWPFTEFYVAAPGDYGSPTAISPNRRGPVEPNIRYLHRLDHLQHAKLGLSKDPSAILVGNSSYGALNVAYLMGARKIGFLGLDGKGGYAWASGAPKNLTNLKNIFSHAVKVLKLEGVEVKVGSRLSKIDLWPRCSPEEVVEWLRR